MNIVLIGFMGSGKTTVSHLLAERLHMKCVDTDDLVEEASGMKTAEIFSMYGETRYRELEIQVARRFRTKNDYVVATGGGVVLNKIILDYFVLSGGVIVYLHTKFETLVTRVMAHDRPRPLFADVSRAKKLYIFRLPIYQAYADIQVNTDKKKPDEIVTEIANIMNKNI